MHYTITNEMLRAINSALAPAGLALQATEPVTPGKSEAANDSEAGAEVGPHFSRERGATPLSNPDVDFSKVEGVKLFRRPGTTLLWAEAEGELPRAFDSYSFAVACSEPGVLKCEPVEHTLREAIAAGDLWWMEGAPAGPQCPHGVPLRYALNCEQCVDATEPAAQAHATLQPAAQAGQPLTLPRPRGWDDIKPLARRAFVGGPLPPAGPLLEFVEMIAVWMEERIARAKAVTPQPEPVGVAIELDGATGEFRCARLMGMELRRTKSGKLHVEAADSFVWWVFESWRQINGCPREPDGERTQDEIDRAFRAIAAVRELGHLEWLPREVPVPAASAAPSYNQIAAQIGNTSANLAAALNEEKVRATSIIDPELVKRALEPAPDPLPPGHTVVLGELHGCTLVRTGDGLVVSCDESPFPWLFSNWASVEPAERPVPGASGRETVIRAVREARALGRLDWLPGVVPTARAEAHKDPNWLATPPADEEALDRFAEWLQENVFRDGVGPVSNAGRDRARLIMSKVNEFKLGPLAVSVEWSDYARAAVIRFRRHGGEHVAIRCETRGQVRAIIHHLATPAAVADQLRDDLEAGRFDRLPSGDEPLAPEPAPIGLDEAVPMSDPQAATPAPAAPEYSSTAPHCFCPHCVLVDVIEPNRWEWWPADQRWHARRGCKATCVSTEAAAVAAVEGLLGFGAPKKE